MTLSAHAVSASYRAGQTVVDEVDLHVDRGGFALVLGHNGAGKTTLMNVLFGIHRADAGDVRVDGTPLSPGSMSRLDAGVSFVPSEHAVFPRLTVNENLQVCRDALGRRRRSDRGGAVDVLTWFPVLGDKRRARAGSLSGGQRRMLAVAMSLVQQPRYLLMDEPSLGLAPSVVDDLFESLGRLRSDLGLGMVVVEQAVRSSLLTADTITVVRGGRAAFNGDAQALAQHDLWDLL